MTLLSSVNNVLRYLRREEASELSSGNLEHKTLVGFLNDAADEILGAYQWSFLKRDDGVAFLPGRFSETTGALVLNGTASASLRFGANSWSSTYATLFSTNVRAKVRFSGDPDFGQTSYTVTNFSTFTFHSATLGAVFRGTTDSTSVPFEVYTHEYVLPDTVRQVLSVRHEEEPLRLENMDRHFELDSIMPRVTDSFQESPDVVYVGGLATTTTLNGGDSTTGMVMAVWPPPSADLQLNYSYIYRHAELADGADEWTGVPREVVSLIESMAFERALDSNMEREPERAAAVAIKNGTRLRRLLSADGKLVHQRYVPREIGTARYLRHPNARWESRVVEAP